MTFAQIRAVARLARRSAWRHPWRTGLIAALIAVAVGIGAFSAIALRTVSPSVEGRVAADFGGASMTIDLTPYSDEAAAWVNAELARVVPDAQVVSINTLYRGGGELVAVDLASPLVDGMYVVIEGRAPERGEIAVSWSLARGQHLAVGDSYEIEGVDRPLTISAIVVARGNPSRRMMVLPPGGIDPAIGRGRNRFGEFDRQIRWLVDGDFDSEAMTQRIQADWDQALSTLDITDSNGDSPSLNVMSREFSQRMGLYTLDPTGPPPSLISTLAATLLLAEVAFLAAAAYATGIRRRLREIGLIATQGATARQIRGAVIGEALLTGVIGAGLGAALAVAVAFAGRPLAQRFINPLITRIELAPGDLVGPMAVAVVAAVVAAWLPARTASRVSVLAALHGRMPMGKPPRWVVPASLGAVGFGLLLIVVAQSAAATAARVQAGIGILLVVIGGALAGVPIVTAAGRLAHRLPVIARLVARDSARQAIRSAAAITALLVVVTGTVAIATAMRTSEASTAATYGTGSGDPRFVFVLGEFVGEEPTAENPVFIPEYELSQEQEQQVTAILPRAARYEVTMLPGRAFSTAVTHLPGFRGDQICSTTRGYETCTGISSVDLNLAIVDPSLLDEISTPEARDRLEEGEPVVLGNTRSTMEIQYRDETFNVDVYPANISQWEMFRLVVPEAWASQRGLLADTHRAVFFVNDAPISVKERQEFYSTELAVSFGSDGVFSLSKTETLAIVLAAALLGVGMVIAIVTALSSTESNRDLAVMVAVGAAPSLRRRFLGIQSSFYVAAAGLVAVPIGLLLMRVAGDQGIRFGPLGVWTGGIAIPWRPIVSIVVALPFIVGLGTALFTRSLPARPPRRIT